MIVSRRRVAVNPRIFWVKESGRLAAVMAQDTEQGIEHDVESEPDDKPQDKEFMATLAKGLALLGAFDKQRPTMTLSEAAKVTGFSRATARRILRTLAELGYVAQNGRAFSLSSGILRLGFAYLALDKLCDSVIREFRGIAREQRNESDRIGLTCVLYRLHDALADLATEHGLR